jgi:hypothetical protein
MKKHRAAFFNFSSLSLNFSRRRTHSTVGGGMLLSEALGVLLDRCKSLSGRCLRTLRLELSCVLIHYLQVSPPFTIPSLSFTHANTSASK